MGQRHAAMEDVVSSPSRDFWEGRRVLLTGHTGFKGAWMAIWLDRLGAQVTGYALAPEGDPNLWSQIGDRLSVREVIGDLSDREALRALVTDLRPSIVIHMAAQSLVRRSYAQPVETFSANLMGTVHLLDALRDEPALEAALMVTTDKVYANLDEGRDFVEEDPLGGNDPYSASKAAAEIATKSYALSFFRQVPVATARAGNVIGGGDWSEDRLIPDVWRAIRQSKPLVLRHPEATRPWQHVVDALSGYLLYLEALATKSEVPRALNFGPLPGQSATVGEVAEITARALGTDRGWIRDEEAGPREMKLLSLDPSKAMNVLSWHPRLHCYDAVGWTAEWYSRHQKGDDPLALCRNQIAHYEALS